MRSACTRTNVNVQCDHICASKLQTSTNQITSLLLSNRCINLACTAQIHHSLQTSLIQTTQTIQITRAQQTVQLIAELQAIHCRCITVQHIDAYFINVHGVMQTSRHTIAQQLAHLRAVQVQRDIQSIRKRGQTRQRKSTFAQLHAQILACSCTSNRHRVHTQLLQIFQARRQVRSSCGSSIQCDFIINRKMETRIDKTTSL